MVFQPSRARAGTKVIEKYNSFFFFVPARHLPAIGFALGEAGGS